MLMDGIIHDIVNLATLQVFVQIDVSELQEHTFTTLTLFNVHIVIQAEPVSSSVANLRLISISFKHKH